MQRDSGVGASVLVRQAQGLEGVLPLLVHTGMLDAPATEGEDPGDTAAYLDPITPSHVHRPGHHYMITGLDEFVRFEPHGLPDLGEFVREPP